MTALISRPWRLLVLCLLAVVHAPAGAQELEARAYAPNPVDARFAIVSLAYSDGDMLLNGSSPIKDFEVEATTLYTGLGGTFAVGDRVASLAVLVPFVDGTATGVVNGVPERADRSGISDVKLRFGLSLLPGSAQDPATFAKAAPDRTLGAGLMIVVPTGEYYADKLVNLGTNRWAIKPEIGGWRRFGRWSYDGSVGVWLYAANDEFFGDRERRQDPLAAVQGHVSYTFKPRLWVGLGATWYAGGTTEIDGLSDHNRQSNSRVGLTLALPIGSRHSVKVACSTGVTARFGGDLDTCGVTWQYLWFRQ